MPQGEEFWTDSFGTTGFSQPTFRHSGCPVFGCAGGRWPQIDGASWVWKSENVTHGEALVGIPPVEFVRSFSIPTGATSIGGSITDLTRRTKDLVSWLRSSAARASSESDWDTSAPFVRRIYLHSGAHATPITLGFSCRQIRPIVADGLHTLSRWSLPPSDISLLKTQAQGAPLG